MGRVLAPAGQLWARARAILRAVVVGDTMVAASRDGGVDLACAGCRGCVSSGECGPGARPPWDVREAARTARGFCEDVLQAFGTREVERRKGRDGLTGVVPGRRWAADGVWNGIKRT